MRTLKSPLFGTRIPAGRAGEFIANLKHPERTAFTVSTDLAGDYTYREYPTREAMIVAIHKGRSNPDSWQRGTFPRPVVPCPHGLEVHC